jgi:hypothetical protein
MVSSSFLLFHNRTALCELLSPCWRKSPCWRILGCCGLFWGLFVGSSWALSGLFVDYDEGILWALCEVSEHSRRLFSRLLVRIFDKSLWLLPALFVDPLWSICGLFWLYRGAPRFNKTRKLRRPLTWLTNVEFCVPLIVDGASDSYREWSRDGLFQSWSTWDDHL